MCIPSYVMLTFETKIPRSVTFVQVNLMSVAPTLQILRIGLRRRQSGKSKVPAKQRWSWPKVYYNSRSMKEQHSSHLTFGNRCLPAWNLKPEEREFVIDFGVSMHVISKKRTWVMLKWIPWRSRIVHDSHNSQCRSADAWRGHSVRQRIGYILDKESPRGYASSVIAWKALRWKRIFLRVHQRSRTASH